VVAIFVVVRVFVCAVIETPSPGKKTADALFTHELRGFVFEFVLDLSG